MANKIITFFKLIKTIKNYPLYLRDYFGKIKNKYIVYKLRNGLKYKIRGGSTDRFIINEVWIHKSYNPKGFEINKNDIVIDIGAHAGIFTILASYYAKNGKVYAFEPMKENYELLKENIKLNYAKNIEAINKAVSNKSGKLKFYVSQTKNKGQNSFYKLSDTQKQISVEKISFKNFIKKIPKINFLKIDCEGAEYEILFSLSKKELEKIKKISMEFHNYGKYNGEDLARFLQKNDFKVKLIQDGKMFGRIYARNAK
ncbi:MAG: FkbM family methyltransferase [Nanoarchaeota archaeon]|nr:FkbM family methyltransferase [Nanoarchaeota archaeon]